MMRAIKKSIATFKENLNKLSTEEYAKRISHLSERMSAPRAVMLKAHSIRRHAAEVHDCKASDILFAECLKLAWAALRAWKAATSKPFSSSFVSFEQRTSSEADRQTWVRMEAGSITVARAAGAISTGYLSEITDFCKGFGVDFASILPGTRLQTAC